VDVLPAEPRVAGKRRRIEPDQCGGHRNLAGESVVGDVQIPEAGLVESRNGSRKRVVFKVKDVQSPEIQ